MAPTPIPPEVAALAASVYAEHRGAGGRLVAGGAAPSTEALVLADWLEENGAPAEAFRVRLSPTREVTARQPLDASEIRQLAVRRFTALTAWAARVGVPLAGAKVEAGALLAGEEVFSRLVRVDLDVRPMRDTWLFDGGRPAEVAVRMTGALRLDAHGILDQRDALSALPELVLSVGHASLTVFAQTVSTSVMREVFLWEVEVGGTAIAGAADAFQRIVADDLAANLETEIRFRRWR